MGLIFLPGVETISIFVNGEPAAACSYVAARVPDSCLAYLGLSEGDYAVARVEPVRQCDLAVLRAKDGTYDIGFVFVEGDEVRVYTGRCSDPAKVFSVSDVTFEGVVVGRCGGDRVHRCELGECYEVEPLALGSRPEAVAERAKRAAR